MPIPLDSAAILLVVLFAVQSVFAMVRAWLFTVAGERIVTSLRAKLFEAILRQDIEFFDSSRTGELTNRLAADTAVLQNTVTVNVSMALRHALGVVGGGALLLYTSPRLTVAAMAVTSGAEVSLWLTGEAAWFALPGRAAEFSLPHAAPLSGLLEAVLTGGTVTVCSQCAARREISEGDVVEGVRVAGAAVFAEEVLRDGVQALVY